MIRGEAVEAFREAFDATLAERYDEARSHFEVALAETPNFPDLQYCLGVSLFMIIRDYTFFQSVAFGFGGGVGWTLAIVLIAGLRQKMGYSDVPGPFRGVAIAMVITGVMAMAFMGFTGVDSGVQSALAMWIK